MASDGDRLTSLHDNLLSHILSRLPTKEAVQTSILSKHWRHKWTTIYNVDTDFQSWIPSFTFCNFLSTILISHQHLRRFRATFGGTMSDDIQKWINAALTHNLEFLDVNINTNDIDFPISLLNNNSLIELKVVQPCPTLVRVIVAENVRAPNLTSLSLYGVDFENPNDDSSSVSFDFPALQRLEFRGVGFQRTKNVKSMVIYAPSLISIFYEPSFAYMIQPCDYSTKIVAPRLTSFTCVEGLPENFEFDGSSVVYALLSSRAELQLETIIGSQARDLLNGFINLEELTLSRRMAEVLRNVPPLHHHNKLKRLILLSGCNADQLFQLLHATPSLKFLSVNVDEWEDYNYEAMEIIPSCIASNLDEVVLQVFSGKIYQYKLAEFLLKTARNLKKLTITKNDVGASNVMKEVLSAFFCCSPSLAVCSRLPDIEPTYTRVDPQFW